MVKNLIKNLNQVPKNKKLIIFDLDGTLVETKSVMDDEMSALFCQLLSSKKVAVIGGGKYGLFKEQIVKRLKCSKELLTNLFLFPTTATSFYRYNRGWKKVYFLELSKKERAMIKKAFREAFKEISYQKPEKTYGPVIEDRRTQVTFSVFGQDLVKVLGEKGVQIKKEWKDKHTDIKLKLAEAVQKRIPNLEVRAAGYTSIDVTRKGIDKEYGVRQIEKYLKIPIKDMLFIGDALFPGGNDSAALRTGVLCIEVKTIGDTKGIIKYLIGN